VQQCSHQAGKGRLLPDQIKEIAKRLRYPTRNKKSISQIWGEKASAKVIIRGRIKREATSYPGVKRAWK